MSIDTLPPSAQQGRPRKPRPWFTPVAPPPDTVPFAIQRMNRERVHRAVGANLKRNKWFAAALVADLGYELDNTDFAAPFRARPYLALGTTYWRQTWNKGRVDLAIVPCSEAELKYYGAPVAAEIAQYAFKKYSGFGTYRVVLGGFGEWVETYAKWGQQ